MGLTYIRAHQGQNGLENLLNSIRQFGPVGSDVGHFFSQPVAAADSSPPALLRPRPSVSGISTASTEED